MRNQVTRMRGQVLRFGVSALLVALVAPAAAWANGPGDGSGNKEARKERRAKFVAKMKAHRGKMLREKLGLNEERAKQVEVVMERFHGQRRALHQQMEVHHKALRKLLKADSNDQQAYKKAVDGMIAGRDKMQQLKREQIGQLRKLLTPKEQAKAMLLMHRMKRRMHHKMMRMHHGKGGKGWRGGKGRRGGGPAAEHAGWEHEGPPMHDGPPPHGPDGGPPEDFDDPE